MTGARTCPECGARFTAAHPRKLFCAKACGVAFNNRQLQRGQALVSLAQAWRAGKHLTDKRPADQAAAAVARREVCRLLDLYNAQDKAAGRANALRLYRARTAAGLLDE